MLFVVRFSNTGSTCGLACWFCSNTVCVLSVHGAFFCVANDCLNDYMCEFAKFSGRRGEKANKQKRLFPLGEKTMAEIKLRAFFYRNNFNLRGCAGVATTGGTRNAHHFIHGKRVYCLLLPLASRGRPMFHVVSCHDLLCQDWVICTPFLQKPNTIRIIPR